MTLERGADKQANSCHLTDPLHLEISGDTETLELQRHHCLCFFALIFLFFVLFLRCYFIDSRGKDTVVSLPPLSIYHISLKIKVTFLEMNYKRLNVGTIKM